MSSSYPPRKGEARLAEYPYPPSRSPYDPSTGKSSMASDATKYEAEHIPMTRTPSPTPSELEALKTGALDWKALSSWRFWFRRDWLLYYIIFFVILVVSVLLVIYHTQIVHWLTPVATWLHKFQFGWLVPIAVLFVISFPPLFGHEIVAVLCGLVWGLWIGFAIVSAGTFLGEVGNFYAFKYCCRARGEKLERTKISYACLAKVVRDGGFKIALIARLSAIPGHFTTAVFATCGMGIITFSIAAILSMPKQFITVYLGVILETSSTGQRSTKSRIISDVVVGLTVLVTFAAMWWIYRKMSQVKPSIVYERRKARQAKLARAEFTPYSNVDATGSAFSVGFNPQGSELDIPLTSGSDYTPVHQQWDKEGHAVGYAGNPLLYAPQPKRVSDARAVGGSLAQPDVGDRYSYSPGARYERAPVRVPSDDSWEAEREYDHRRGAPTSSTSAIPLDPYPTAADGIAQKSGESRAMSPPALVVSPPPRMMQQQTQQPDAPTQVQPKYTLTDLGSLPEPSYGQAGRKAVPSASKFYAHDLEASDDSFVTAVGSHSRAGTEMRDSSDLR